MTDEPLDWTLRVSVDGAQRLRSAQFGRAVQAALVERHHVHAFPVVADRTAQFVRASRVVADLVDHHQGFAEREGGGAPVQVGGHGVERNPSKWPVEVSGEQRCGVECQGHDRSGGTHRPRTSRSS